MREGGIVEAGLPRPFSRRARRPRPYKTLSAFLLDPPFWFIIFQPLEVVFQAANGGRVLYRRRVNYVEK